MDKSSLPSALPEKIALRIPEASHVSGLSRSKLYELIRGAEASFSEGSGAPAHPALGSRSISRFLPERPSWSSARHHAPKAKQGLHMTSQRMLPQCARNSLNFRQLREKALSLAEQLLITWLPCGRKAGSEWVARNPTRADRRPGSFKVNLRSGRWADFATGDAGGDLISLRAYLDGISQGEAARRIAREIGA